jgi:hypothetical protein
MKNLLNFIIGLFITSVGLAMGYKLYERSQITIFDEPGTTSISLLVDVTDTTIKSPDISEIIAWSGYQEMKSSTMWNGVTVRVSSLSDVDLNQTKEIRLPAQNPWLSNEFERAKEITKFKSQATDLINDLSWKVGRNQSSVIRPLSQELTRLSKETAEQRVLFVYSDLMENTGEISLYKPKDLKAFMSEGKSDDLFNRYLGENTDLHGIRVYFIYQPINTNDNAIYMQVSEVFMDQLKSRGAEVFRNANLIY